MEKILWKPGNMVYPVPAVLVTCGSFENPGDEAEHCNILTVAWTGTVCSDPAMVYISVRPERYSHHFITESREFVINLTTEALTAATDTCGVKSGRNVNKFALCRLTPEKASVVRAPLLAESPVNIECRVTEIKSLGSHDMFLAEVVAVHVSPELLDENGRLMLENAHLMAYSHGQYLSLGRTLGSFGYSVKKNSPAKNRSRKGDKS